MGKKIKFMHKIMKPYTLIYTFFEGLFVQSAPNTIRCVDGYNFELNTFIFLTWVILIAILS